METKNEYNAKKKGSNELTLDNYSLDNLSSVMMMVEDLTKIVISKKLTTNIQGKQYMNVDGWQLTGGLLGLRADIINLEKVPNEKNIVYRAQANIINQKGDIIGTGYAMCSNAEPKKARFDEYAICSMAQTRAIGKAYRNRLGWVVRLAGFKATPAEEMEGVEYSKSDQEQQETEKPLKKGTLDKARFGKAIEAIKSKKYNAQDLEYKFELSAEQKSELSKMEKSIEYRQNKQN